MTSQNVRILVGEKRELGIEVINLLGQDFVIDAAEYTIENTNGEIIEQGFPTINNKQLLVLFNATAKGRFYVIFKYHIGPEILKAKMLVEVI